VFFSVDRHSNISIQEQLRTKIVAAVLDGQLLPGALLPSTRALAKILSISRTTVVSVYEKLAEDGFLVAKDRSGFCVNPDAKPLRGASEKPDVDIGEGRTKSPINWSARYKLRPSEQRNIRKPKDWQTYKYPFVFGQSDPTLFPLAAWRECSRQAMSELAMREWSADAIAEDEPHLVQEIKSKLLPRRGIYADDSEILITSGAQNALFLVASLLMDKNTVVGMEEPGYPDARNIFEIQGAEIYPMQIDVEGAELPDISSKCDYFFLTPSHQSSTTVTLSSSRRKEFLCAAALRDSVIIEDDFESETNYLGAPVPAMKSEDKEGRIIYVGSLSKSMFPGLRLGYIVANSNFIEELRSFRRLVLRHAPSNNQRTASLFIGQGFHDTYIRKLNRIYLDRWQTMRDNLDRYLPGMSISPTFGGTSFWLEGPEGSDSEKIAADALKQGIVIEPGLPHFKNSENKKHFFRLGFSSISKERIPEGLRLLSLILDK